VSYYLVICKPVGGSFERFPMHNCFSCSHIGKTHVKQIRENGSIDRHRDHFIAPVVRASGYSVLRIQLGFGCGIISRICSSST
jgi:hypothetical protein